MNPTAVTALSSWPGSPGSRRAGFVLWLAAALGGCQALPADAGPPKVSTAASAIHTITLERGCFGCADGGLLVLRRDGAATHTVTGNARHGTVDKVSQGRISESSFDKLAGLLVAQGFFGLDDVYQDPQVRDGAWVTLGVSGSGPAKQVFSREGAGPKSLQQMASAVEAAKAQIRFTP